MSLPWQSLRPTDIEELIATMLVRTVASAVRIDADGESAGVEVVAPGSAGDHIFEIRTFCERLTAAQRKLVFESLGAAVARQPDMEAWTLVLPLDPSPSEHRWLRDVLAAKATVKWMGRTALEAALIECPDLVRAYVPNVSEHRVERSPRVSNTLVGGSPRAVVQTGNITGDVYLPAAMSRGRPEVVARQLPATTEFVGRALELVLLQDALRAEPSSVGAVVVLVVAGMAGVGKTAIAVKAAHAAVDCGGFPGGVLFLDLRGYEREPIGPAQALDFLLRGLGVPSEEIPPGTDDRVGLYRSVLAGSAGPVLVVLDNVSAAEQVRPLLPGDGRHRVLVTSRHSLPQLEARCIELGVLTADEADDLLDATVRLADPADARIARDHASSRRVVSCCGNLPLALRIAAALLVLDPVKPVGELAVELAEARTRLDHLDDGERAVRAAFDLSYDRLPPEQARLFRLLGAHPGPDVATGTVAVLADRAEPVVQVLLARLVRAHLIEPASVRGRWRMHDLIRIYAEQVPGPRSPADERRAARARLGEHLVWVADAADDHLRALPTSPKPAEFANRDEALAWFDAERATLVSVTRMAAEHGRDDIATHLAGRLVEYFSWRRHLEDWLTTAELSRDAAVRLGDRELTTTAHVNYGYILREMGRTAEAIDVSQTAAAVARSTGNQHAEAAALSNLGSALRHVGRLDESISVCSEARDVFRRTGDRRGEAQALNNLVNSLTEAGRISEAGEIHTEHLELCRRTGDRIGESRALLTIGNIYEKSGDAQAALGSFEAAMAICREEGNVPLSNVLSDSIGRMLGRLGRSEEAMETFQRNLDTCLRAQDLSGEVHALVGIASVLGDFGSLSEALDTCRQAATRAEESNHLNVKIVARTTLVNILIECELWTDLIVACRYAADLYGRAGQPVNQAHMLLNCGHALEKEGRREEAVRAHTEAAFLYRTTHDQRGLVHILVGLLHE